MSIIKQSGGFDFYFGTNADVRLERVDANTIRLTGVPLTSKRIFVRDIVLDLSTDLTIDTDSASEYIITGTTTVAKGNALSTLTTGYNDYTLNYVYLCNENPCWVFSGYDRRSKLIISANVPTSDGYLASSGNGLHARHVGWFILNSSRQTEHALSVCSTFNQRDTALQLTGTDAGWTAINTGAGYYTTISGCSTRIIVPSGTKYKVQGSSAFNNDSATLVATDLRLYVDTVVKHIYWYGNINNAAGYVRGGSSTTSFSENVSSTSVKLIELKWLTGGGGSPQYYGPYSYLRVERSGDVAPSGFTRVTTFDYESISRTLVGGRLERVSDTSLEWQPAENGSIGLYNGLQWITVTPNSNPSATNSVNDLDSAALTYDSNYDVFAEWLNEYGFTLVFKKWTDATTRAVSPERYQGILVYDAHTDAGRKRRFLGTIRLRNATGAKFTDQTDKRFISNYYNKQNKICYYQAQANGATTSSTSYVIWTNWTSPGASFVSAYGFEAAIGGNKGLTGGTPRGLTRIYLDGAGIGKDWWSDSGAGDAQQPVSDFYAFSAGYHYLDTYVKVGAGSGSLSMWFAELSLIIPC